MLITELLKQSQPEETVDGEKMFKQLEDFIKANSNDKKECRIKSKNVGKLARAKRVAAAGDENLNKDKEEKGTVIFEGITKKKRLSIRVIVVMPFGE